MAYAPTRDHANAEVGHGRVTVNFVILTKVLDGAEARLELTNVRHAAPKPRLRQLIQTGRLSIWSWPEMRGTVLPKQSLVEVAA
jgi:hypothetical protein